MKVIITLYVQVAALLQISDSTTWTRDKCRFTRGGDFDLTREHLCTEDMIEFCAYTGLSRFKIPRVICAQHARIPENSSGKILKACVRDIILSEVSPQASKL